MLYPKYTLQFNFICVENQFFPMSEYKSSSLLDLLCLLPSDSWILFRNWNGEPFELIGRG